jgi:exodeoxyribonuclease VII large subunit
LIDFAADRRAPTPTAAAEMAVPVRVELMNSLANLGSRKLACWRRNVERYRKELRLLARALPALDDLLAAPRQRLDACAGRLPRALRANAQIHHTQLTRAASRLSPRLLSHRIDRCREQTAAFGDRARRAFRIFRDRRVERLRSAGQLLAAYSYRGVLTRGFALVRDDAGRPLRRAAAVGPGTRLDIEFSDGRVGATADGERAAQSPAKSKPRSRGSGGSGGQGSLFGA